MIGRARDEKGTGIRILLLAPVLAALTLAPLPSRAGEETNRDMLRQAPKVYVDCSLSGRRAWRACDLDHLRAEVNFVNYVRDRNESDIHILITSQDSAGGIEYTVAFMGRKAFLGVDDTLHYYSNRVDAEDTVRQGLVRIIQAGLMRYIARCPLVNLMNFSLAREMKPAPVDDKWDHWIFSLYAGGYIRGEEMSRRSELSGRFSARRATPDLKLDFEIDGSSNVSRYVYTEEGETVVYESLTRNFQCDSLAVFSLGEHWSAGGSARVESDTYDNTRLAVQIAPAVEFNLFPYSESTRKQCRFLYSLRFSRVSYLAETIYDKLGENLLSQALTVDLVVKQPWGTAQTSLEASHYFHDLFKHSRLSLWAYLDLKVFKGFSLDLSGSYAVIHDQLSLEKGELSPEEVLLQRKQMATNYRYRIYVGLSYTFGSIFSNVVNPRFGNGY
ncbi:MAG: hypothetical protein JW747_00585 [Candidatus Aminicenantes bacterium]|nr:hypothetical protein [Candidatus Aminicenantes bacterium]